MKNIILSICLLVLASCNSIQEEEYVAEVSCGQCQFGLTEPKGCDLAVKIKDNAYFVDGLHIDDFGDAHDKTLGFCEVIRKAKIKGIVEEGRFKASHLKLIEEKK